MKKWGKATLFVIGLLGLVAASAAVGYGVGVAAGPRDVEATPMSSGKPTIVSPAYLHEISPLLGIVYWAGERQDAKIELTVTPESVVIRYLDEDMSAGDEGEALTVATYRNLAGYEALQNLGEGATVTESNSGALIAVPENNAGSTYFAFPNGAFQVEVFSPRAGESFDLVSAGDVLPVFVDGS